MNTTPQDARKKLEDTSIKSEYSLATGLIICTFLSIIISILCCDKSLEVLFVFIVIFFFIGVLGLNNVPIAHHAVIAIFGARILKNEFDNGQKSILAEGWHWLPPWIGYAIVIDTRERSIIIKDMNVVVRNPQKEETGIIVAFKEGQISYLPFNPFAILNTGENDIDKEINAVVQEAIRDQAATLEQENSSRTSKAGPELIFSAKVNDAIKKKLYEAGDPERWGIIILGVKTPRIEFANKGTEEAFESRYKESREQEAEATQTETLKINAQTIAKEFKVSDEKALEIAQRISGKLRPSDIVISGGDGGFTSLGAQIAAVVAQINKNQNEEGGK